MMQMRQPEEILLTLKGVKWAVLCLLYFRKAETLTQEYIERWTGYTDKPVSQALATLTEMGYITRNRGGWQFASGVVQLPLMAEELPEQAVDDESGVDESEIVGNFPTPLESSSGSILENQENGPLPDSRALEQTEKFRLVLEACEDCGIREPARSQIAKIPGVSAETVRYHCREAPNLGAAIYRIKNGWRAKGGPDPGERRYIDGAFAEYIEH